MQLFGVMYDLYPPMSMYGFKAFVYRKNYVKEKINLPVHIPRSVVHIFL